MTKDKVRCINLDWLEVYALEPREQMPMDANWFRSRGFVVSERPYGTRVFRSMFTIDDDHGQPFVEVRCAPFQSEKHRVGFMPPNGVHLRLTNNALYTRDPIQRLRDFMIDVGYELVRIYRIDIALDFERFDFGDDPARFIERYMRGRYAKINQANISAYGSDMWAGRVWNSLSWGNLKSMVSTKFYCKSLELAQARDKPWIRFAWFNAELVDSPVTLEKRDENGHLYKPVIWRVEFSIKASAKTWYKIETSGRGNKEQPMPHVLSCYDTSEKLLLVFASLQRHYFYFKKYEEGVRKDRCETKRLFDFHLDDKLMKLEHCGGVCDSFTKVDRLIDYLRNFLVVFTDREASEAAQTVIDYLENHKLRNMALTDRDYAKLQALRALIRERLEGYTEKPVMQHYNELIDLFLSPDAPF